MCQFRDNILVASNADPTECKELVSLVKSVLENARGLPVECSCRVFLCGCKRKLPRNLPGPGHEMHGVLLCPGVWTRRNEPCPACSAQR